ncbi:hypothetical protein BJV78DRAFT_1287477 [Lactifluus subvellereus]|nr:hypothetical protein BJV78DRAFT_1287477 [Lactifluus subvellereus]
MLVATLNPLFSQLGYSLGFQMLRRLPSLWRRIEQEEHQRLIEEFDALLERHAKEQVELAQWHNIKLEYLDKLKGTSKHYKVKRGVNLENVKIHKKSVEMNADRDAGNRVCINELHQLVKDDPNLQNLLKAQEAELREELMSAAQDYRRQLEQLNDEITSLSECTGTTAMCFFTRTNLEDSFEPNWICSTNAANFTEDTFNRNMWDIARLFEQAN